MVVAHHAKAALERRYAARPRAPTSSRASSRARARAPSRSRPTRGARLTRPPSACAGTARARDRRRPPPSRGRSTGRAPRRAPRRRARRDPSALSSSSNVRPESAARSAAARTISCAPSPPGCPARRKATRSATISPSVSSRFSRIRSASTSSPSTASRDRPRRTARVRERTRERVPLGLPGAGGALVLLDDRPCEDGRVPARELRARASEGRPHGVALLRQRGRPAAGPLPHLSDLRLREQCDVEPDLREHSGGRVERAAELGDPRPVRVPGQRRRRQVELLREETEHLHAVLAEGRQRPGRAAELGREPLRLGPPRACAPPRARPRATRPPCSRTSSEPPAGAACGLPSASSDASRRVSPAPPPTRSSSTRTSSSARLATSIEAVSITSWLVAPQCT